MMVAPLSWVRTSEDLRSPSSYCFGALADIHALASARNAASCGVSSKFMAALSLGTFPGCCAALLRCAADPGSICGSRLREAAQRALHRVRDTRNSLRRVLLAHAVDQLIFPIGQAAEPERRRVGAAVVHVAVELPGEAPAGMDLDVCLCPVLERLPRADPRCGRRLPQFRRL